MTDVTASTDLRALLHDAESRLAQAGVESPRWDVEQLAAHALGIAKSQLVLVGTVDADAAARLAELVERRVERVPLQHLTGRVGFRYIDVEVGAGVFVPRPESEVVAGFAIDWLAERPSDGPVVVELCAGSAAIALSVSHEVPSALVHAVEVDARALEWARRNAAARAAAGDRPIALHHADVTTSLPELDGRVDCVVANPPYVAESELAGLDPEVRDHDPRRALVAGPDGLDVIRDVVRRSHALLRPGGLLVVEHSDRQGESAPAVVRESGAWTAVADHEDLTGRPRFVTAFRGDAP